MTWRPVLLIVLAVTIAFIWGIGPACDTFESKDFYDRYEDLAIDTIIVSSTLHAQDTVLVIYSYPAGCNRFHSADYSVNVDTVLFTVTFHFYYHGVPCAHGPGVDTVVMKVTLDSPGTYYATYLTTRGDTAAVAFLYE